MAFDANALMRQIQALNTLLHRGDELGTPLPEVTRALVLATVGEMCKRLFNTILGPTEEAVKFGDLFNIVVAADCFVAAGDGHATPLSMNAISLTHAMREAVADRMSAYDRGSWAVMGLNASAEAKAAAAIADKHPKPVMERAPAAAQPAPPPAPAPAPRPPFPATLPPPNGHPPALALRNPPAARPAAEPAIAAAEEMEIPPLPNGEATAVSPAANSFLFGEGPAAGPEPALSPPPTPMPERPASPAPDPS